MFCVCDVRVCAVRLRDVLPAACSRQSQFLFCGGKHAHEFGDSVLDGGDVWRFPLSRFGCFPRGVKFVEQPKELVALSSQRVVLEVRCCEVRSIARGGSERSVRRAYILLSCARLLFTDWLACVH